MPNTPNAVIRSYASEWRTADVDKEDRSIVATINTSGIDRYRTIIRAEGISLDGYKRNPVVLWEHGKDPNRGTLPIGRNMWVKQERGKLIAKTAFRKDDYSQQLWEAYRDGDLRGWSVNVLPRKAAPPTREQITADRSLEGCEMIYDETELAEYSGTAVPGNADTLSILASRGIWIPGDVAPPAITQPEVVQSEKPFRRYLHRGNDGAPKQHAPAVNPLVVHLCNGQTMTFATEAEAIEARKLMGGGLSLELQMVGLVGELRSKHDEAAADVKAFIDLWKHGRV